MASRWVDLDNGMKYNPDTGETYLKDASGKIQYRFNPTTGKTTYAGKDYAGKLDPYILSSLSGDDISLGQNNNAAYLDKQLGKLEKNPFIVGSELANYGDAYAEKKYSGALKPTIDTYDRLTMASAYDSARKKYSGPTFFDQVKGMDFSEKKAPPADLDVEAIKNNSNLPPAVKEAILAKAQPQTPAAVPNQVQTPVMPEPTPVQQPTAPQQPTQAQGPDWKALYDQVSGYFTEIKNKQALGTPRQRQQISSFQQYGPAQIQRQQTPATSYGRSTPYSGKGA